FTGVWYTMIRSDEAKVNATESDPVQKKEDESTYYEPGEAFVEKNMDDNELFRVEVDLVTKIPEEADLPNLKSSMEYVAFELFARNSDDYGVEFKPYYSKLKVDGSQINPADFVIIEQDGWNKYLLESGGSFRLVLIYPVERNAKEMDLTIRPEFYYKDIIYKVRR
ncbi:MAG: hypothetical protein WCF60_18785, partial [Anaerobacillus sp.]